MHTSAGAQESLKKTAERLLFQKLPLMVMNSGVALHAVYSPPIGVFFFVICHIHCSGDALGRGRVLRYDDGPCSK